MFRLHSIVAAVLGVVLTLEPVKGHASENAFQIDSSSSSYYWQSVPVGPDAQLVTLFCESCDIAVNGSRSSVPLVSVLRDTLGDASPDNDRLTSVWLLSYQRPTLAKRLLAAVPFFYWRVGHGSSTPHGRDVHPLLDLTAPQHPDINAITRDIVQWTMLDSMATPIRASSRAYRSNEIDHERLHLEEALSYLRAAPSSDNSSALTKAELNVVVARLELRKKLLGGFVGEREAKRIGEEGAFRNQRIESHNWELLRQCADKTGLRFEPLQLSGEEGQYAMLWLPLDETKPVPSINTGPIWKLLGIKDPRRNSADGFAKAAFYTREVSENDELLPFGARGVRQVRLLPVSVYSLGYPKQPLLLVDFQSRLHLRRHEMVQRSINEITAGVIGISHFTNWYYYVAADLYDFVAARHGAAMDQSARLDSYSRFRIKLALDRSLNVSLRRELQMRIEPLAINPLESSPDEELRTGIARYKLLLKEAEPGGRLLENLDKSRRAELVRYTQSTAGIVRDTMLHAASLGAYTHRTKSDLESMTRIDRYRRFEHQLEFLEGLAQAGTQPEVAYDVVGIARSVREVKDLLSDIDSRDMRARAESVMVQLKALSQDSELQEECSTAITFLEAQVSATNTGIALEPSALKGLAQRGLP